MLTIIKKVKHKTVECLHVWAAGYKVTSNKAVVVTVVCPRHVCGASADLQADE